MYRDLKMAQCVISCAVILDDMIRDMRVDRIGNLRCDVILRFGDQAVSGLV